MKKMLSAFLLIAVCLCQAVVLKEDLNYSQNTRSWNSQPYWSGKLERENGMLKLIPAEKGGKSWVKILGLNNQMDYYPGQVFRVSVEAKGEGDFTFGVIFYGYRSSEITYLPAANVKLSSEMKCYTAEIVLKKLPERLYCYMNLEGIAPAYVKSFKLENVVLNNAEMKAVSGHQILPLSAAPSPVVYQSNLKNKETLFVQKAGKVFTQTGKTDTDGKVQFQPQKAEEGEYAMTAVSDGAFATVYADIMQDAEYKETEELAKKVNLKKKLHVLIIGDSLSDFYRGRNYVDKLSFWLNKYNPGKFTFRNAGVGGDQLPRVAERLKGMTSSHKAYRQNMYDHLFDEKYDIVFIFLGQNDTYVTRNGNFENPITAQEKQLPLLKEIVGTIRKNSQAKIVLLSPSPSDEQMFLNRVKKTKGKYDGVYGMTKFVDHFDAVNRQFCKDQNFDYIDILTPMRSVRERKSLYVEDGVHLATRGTHVITRELLRWFSEQK